MSSSDFSARRFLTACIAAFVIAICSFGVALFVVDPIGATPGNPLCLAGAKDHDRHAAKSLVAHDLRPRTIVIGTSRVGRGFSREALAKLGPAPVANLGLSGGLPANFSAIADEAAASGRLERAYIGVDFNMLHQREALPVGRPFAGSSYPALERTRLAFLSPDALRLPTLGRLDCRPRLHRDGAPIEQVVLAERRLAIEGDAAQWRPDFVRANGKSEERFRERLGQLRAVIRRLRRDNVEVVLFSAPYREELRALFTETGLDDEFAEFHTEIARLAEEEGVVFIDLHDPRGGRDLGLPACPGGGIGCHYLDLLHYGPRVGERLAAVLAARQSS